MLLSSLLVVAGLGATPVGATAVSTRSPDITAQPTALAEPAFPGPGRYTHGTYDQHGLTYAYSLYVPTSVRSRRTPAPLLVMIHGCGTSADQQARANLLNPLAEAHGFIVLYPDVSVAGAGVRCWRAVFAPAAEGRGKGDAAAIAGMTRLVSRRHHVDQHRVYALGMSSGAFETSVLGASYPDLYAAIGIHSGAAFKRGPAGCVGTYANLVSTADTAAAAVQAEGTRRRVVPVIVFHGDSDSTVAYQCGQQARDQWLETDNAVARATGQRPMPTRPTSRRSGRVEHGWRYTVDTYRARARACPAMQFWSITGMDHFWSGGSTAAASARFTDPRGPSASAAAWDFFSRVIRTPAGYRCTTRH